VAASGGKLPHRPNAAALLFVRPPGRRGGLAVAVMCELAMSEMILVAQGTSASHNPPYGVETLALQFRAARHNRLQFGLGCC